MAKIYDLEGKTVESVPLPRVFETPYRPDVIKRAVLAQQSARRQKYGTDPLAGKRSSAHYHGRRKYRFTMMNKEMARISRIHGKVGPMAWRARVVPQAVKGRKAHPPKAEKVWLERINDKERRLAIKSALAASANGELVKQRGHIAADLPVIFTDDFENLKKAKDIRTLLEKVKLHDELKRCEKRKVRAGRGKTRGRKYRTKKGLLFVVSKKCSVLKAAKNLPGVDVSTADNLNVEMLAPGTQAGRLAVFTKGALERLEKKFA